MKHLRKWSLHEQHITCLQLFDEQPGYGQSYFWYCTRCRREYATAWLEDEDGNSRPWRGVAGLCSRCPPQPFLIQGEITNIVIIKEIPDEVVKYILDRELDFLGHPAHPHNKESM